MRRFLQIVFAAAAVVWSILIWRAVANPNAETRNAAQARTGALLVAFVAGTVALPRRRP